MSNEMHNFIGRLENVLILKFGETVSEEFWDDCESLPEIGEDYTKENKIADIVDIFMCYKTLLV